VRTNLGEKNQFVKPKTLGRKFLMYLECALYPAEFLLDKGQSILENNLPGLAGISLYIYISFIPSKYPLGVMGKKLKH